MVNSGLKKVIYRSSNQMEYLSKLLRDFSQVYKHWQTVSYMKLIVELWSNVAENGKLFLNNQKMLATTFNIMNRKISLEYQKRKSHYKSFGVHHAIPFLNFVKICDFL